MDVRELTIDDLLRFMVEQNASDLHLKPMRPPLIRLNGKLLPLKMDVLPPDLIPKLLNPIMNDRQRTAMEKVMAVDFGYSVPGVSRFRASIFQQRGTMSAVFRRVPFDFRSLDEWDLPEVLKDFGKLPQGLVLITGPTGSGKSSTLAAVMQMISDTRLVHIVTVEDPIEFLLGDNKASVTQREVGTDTPSFSLALRTLLRQDPDVVMVGEMRDASTIQTVITAAETGHLVFSTLHTNGAVQTIDRIIDSFPERSHNQLRMQLAGVLEAVVSLRLVERADKSGLVAAVEILRRSPQTAKLIEQGKLDALEEEIEKSVSYYRMQTLNQSLASLVMNGAVTPETAMATSSKPEDLDLIMRKLLYASTHQDEGEPMGDSVSDFSKIAELQEIKRLYDEMQERHSHDLGERDDIIAQLRGDIESLATSGSVADGESSDLRTENERLLKQVNLLRQEYDVKIERLNARIRELSGTGQQQPQAPQPADAERRGFFRR